MEASFSPTAQPRATHIFGVFGIYRYILATMVMVGHTGPLILVFMSTYAVRAFFILSGYVVCYILYHDYLRLEKGVLKYFVNRALRIYPAYWVTCALSAWLIVYCPEATKEVGAGAFSFLNGSSYPMTLAWLGVNLTMIGTSLPLGLFNGPLLLPVSWSVGTEIFYWVLMPKLLTGAWARRGMIAIAISYTVFVLSLGSFPPSSYTYLKLSYFGLLPGALPFCIGLLIFLHRLRGGWRIPRWLGVACAFAFIAVIGCAWRIFTNPYYAIAYGALAFTTVITLYLSQIDPKTIPRGLQKLDHVCGDLAYPIFLLHQPMEIILRTLFPAFALNTYGFMALTICFTNLAALLIHQVVEVPVNHLRRAIKC